MKTYIVYLSGNEVGTINAANHNSAEKKAQKKYISEVATNERINQYQRANPYISREQVIEQLKHAISVAYTEI